MITHPSIAGLSLKEGLLEAFPDLLTEQALNFIVALQRQFGFQMEKICRQETVDQQTINKKISYQYQFLPDKDCKTIRAGNWHIAATAVPAFMKLPGVILVSPATPEMVVKALSTERRYGSKPVANMLDFEDAFHLDIYKVLMGQRVLQQLKRGKTAYDGYEYDMAKDGKNLVRVRINGFNTPPIDEIHVDGRPIVRNIFDFGLHFFHAMANGMDPYFGPYYVLPKIDLRKAQIWYQLFQQAEKILGVPEKTIKCSAIVETLRGDFEVQEMIFTLAGGTSEDIAALKAGKTVVFEHTYIEALCSGRHDRVFDMVKTYHRHAAKIFPESKYTAMHDIGARAAWSQISEVARLRNLTPVGGMVVALTSDPQTREAAMEITADSLRREHALGSIQAWEATPDTTPLAMSILTQPLSEENYPHQLAPAFNFPYGEERLTKMAMIEQEIQHQLQSTPAAEHGISQEAVEKNIRQAIEYIEAWLRGHGVIAYRSPKDKDKPIIMQNMATAERARAELWTWVHHQVKLSDTGEKLDMNLFKRILSIVINHIKKDLNAGIKVKGKMSVDNYEDSHYDRAITILIQLVDSSYFVENIKSLLYTHFQSVQQALSFAGERQGEEMCVRPSF